MHLHEMISLVHGDDRIIEELCCYLLIVRVNNLENKECQEMALEIGLTLRRELAFVEFYVPGSLFPFSL